jgi:MFS transporter, YNFM family, putative membrane transport protein
MNSSHRRLAAALWCAGLAAFATMYAPQGLLTQISHDAAVDPAQAALLVSAATLGLALSVLPWAWLSNRIGTRSAMRLAAASTAVTAVVVPWLPTFDTLLAGRFLHGIALGGIPALAMALLHNTATPQRVATMAGSYVAATSLGGLSGRLLVVPVADHIGWRAALFVLGCLVAVLMVGLIGLIPRPSAGSADESDNGAVLAHLRDPAMLSLFGIGALLIGGMVVVFNYLPFRLEQAPYRLAPTMVSLIFLAYLGGTAGSRAAGWLSVRVGSVPILAAAGLLTAGGAALTLARPVSVILLGLVVLTTGLFIGHAVASNMVAARANHGRAQATAMYNISYYAGSSAFGWFGGLAWLHAQWFAVAGLVIVLGLGATVLSLRPARRVECALA